MERPGSQITPIAGYLVAWATWKQRRNEATVAEVLGQKSKRTGEQVRMTAQSKRECVRLVVAGVADECNTGERGNREGD